MAAWRRHVSGLPAIVSTPGLGSSNHPRRFAVAMLWGLKPDVTAVLRVTTLWLPAAMPTTVRTASVGMPAPYARGAAEFPTPA